MTFRSEAQDAALRWKVTTDALPHDAREAGHYGNRTSRPAIDICLPVEFAQLNLLDNARPIAMDRFQRYGVPWHHGAAGNPGNHLLSSQVQCANALAPLVDDAVALKALLSTALPIEEVVPFGDPLAPDDLVTFEWIGLSDHLGERKGKAGTRGANSTSSDAAVRYRTPEGELEIALIEWKYTEQYLGHELSGGADSNAVRRARYEALWNDPGSPIRDDRLPYEDLFVEPFYQLFRLQLLADRMEQSKELDADRVRLVYAAPARNAELWSSLNRPSFTDFGEGVAQVWRAMLRRPDRFALWDTGALVAAESPCNEEFRRRYGHIGAGRLSEDVGS